MPGHIARNVANSVLDRAFAQAAGGSIAKGPQQRLKRAGQRHDRAQQPGIEYLARVHQALGVDRILELAQPGCALCAHHLAGLAGEVHAGRVGASAVLLGGVDHGERQREGKVEAEASAGRAG